MVALLVGFPVDFPRGTSSGKAWSFLVRHPTVLLHVVVGTVILVEVIAFLVRSVRSADRRPLTLGALGVISVLVAYAGGLDYVSSGQHESALSVMSAGWVAALVVFIVGWVLGRRALRSASPAASGQTRGPAGSG